MADIVDMSQLRFDFRGRHQGQYVITTYMYLFMMPTQIPPFRRGNPPPPIAIPPSPQEVGRTIHDVLIDNYLACLHNSVTIEKWVLSVLSPDRRQRQQWTEPMARVGVLGGTSLPSNNCCIVRRRTERLSRELNGYICLPGIVQEATQAGRFIQTSAQWQAIVTYGTTMRTWIRRDPWSLLPEVIAFRRKNQVDRYPESALREVVARSVLGVRRSRLPGHGRSG